MVQEERNKYRQVKHQSPDSNAILGILIERYENQKVNQIEAVKTATEAARNNIDAFRKANALQAKFEKAEEKIAEE